MRLADSLDTKHLNLVEPELRPAMESIGKVVRDEAQRFELSPEMIEASVNVTWSRPSSIEAAQHLGRLPFRVCWFEYQPYSKAEDSVRQFFTINTPAPVPDRVGALVECIDETHHRGFVTWIWRHRDGHLMTSPMGAAFDFGPEGYKHKDWLPPSIAQSTEPVNAEFLKKHVGRHWSRFIKDEGELRAMQLQTDRMLLVPTRHTRSVLEMLAIWTPESMAKTVADEIWQNAINDLSGEMNTLRSIVILMNSRNCVRYEKDDLTRLNRARTKARKTPLLPFTKTYIRLTKVQRNRAGGAAATQQQLRAHLVRGHFKVRQSGAYWWSPHIRGHGTPVRRSFYGVRP